jgi:hypothetical protein
MVNNSASNGSSQKFNLKNPLDQNAAYRLSFGGSWTFSDLGAFTNGGNTYADTSFYFFDLVQFPTGILYR